MKKRSDFVIELMDYKGEGGDIEVPQGVTVIADRAFWKSGITSVHIPGSVLEIDKEAFRGCCQLRRVVIDEGLESMGERVFADCPALEFVMLPDSLEECDWSIFAGSTNIREMCVSARSAVRNIPDILGIPAFDPDGNPLPPVPAAESDWLFTQSDGEICINGRTSKTAGTLVEHLDDDATATVYIPAVLAGLPVTAIAEEAFLGDDDMEALYLPDGLRTIGRAAFYDCSELARVRIPETLTQIGDYAFLGYTAIEEDGARAIDRIRGYEVDWNEDFDSEVYGSGGRPDDDDDDDDDDVDFDDDDDGDDEDDGDSGSAAGSALPHAGRVLAFPSQQQAGQPWHTPSFESFYRQARPLFDKYAIDEDYAHAIWEKMTDSVLPRSVGAITLLRCIENPPGLAVCKEIVDALMEIIKGGAR